MDAVNTFLPLSPPRSSAQISHGYLLKLKHSLLRDNSAWLGMVRTRNSFDYGVIRSREPLRPARGHSMIQR